MGAAPERCTTCGTAIPPGESRCPGCGKVYGDDAARPSTVTSGQIVARRGASVGLRAAGALSIGAGVLAAALAVMLIPGFAGVLFAVLLAGAGVGLGALGLKAGAKQSGVADSKQRAEREREVLDLAEKSNGDLTATETARALGVTLEEADRILTDMADGSRVGVDVDTDGIVHYVFRELRAQTDARAAARVRAPVDEPSPAADVLANIEDEISVSEVRSARKKKEL